MARVVPPHSVTRHPDKVTTTVDLNSLSLDTNVISDRKPPLLDDGTLHVLIVIFYYVLQIPVTSFGIGTNILNIVVFTASGQRDSVSIAFTALSISDLGYVTVFLFMRVLSLLIRFYHVHSKLSLGWLIYYVSFFGVLFQDVSVLITVFVAVQKCCCVAIPHLFRRVFSPSRTVGILVCLSLGVVLNYMPMFAGMTFVESTYPPQSNETLIVLARDAVFHRGMSFWRVFNKIALPVVSQGVGVVCLIIMTVQLKKSARFRSSVGIDNDAAAANEDKNSSSYKLGHKERRAVTAVAIVLAMFIISTIPSSLLSLTKVTSPNFFTDPRNKELIAVLSNSQNIPVHVSASVNVFVYLKYNTRYRETAAALFSGGSVKK